MDNIKLLPIFNKIDIELEIPSSKSIANRVLLLSAIANGESIISNVNHSEDVVLMLQALINLGVKIIPITNTSSAYSYKIFGCNGIFPVKNCEIFCGNSGTTMRFLAGVLSIMNGDYTLTGVGRMKERPILDLFNSLEQIGVKISYLEKLGYPPLKTISFVDNNINEISISGANSSQYLSSLLITLSILNKNYIINIIDHLISKPYVDITIKLLKLYGVNIQVSEDFTKILLFKSRLQAINYHIEPDATSASYFLAMGALNGSVTIKNLCINESLQGDKNFAKILEQMGAGVEYLDFGIKVFKKHKLRGININMQDMPDSAMTIAVLALFAEGKTTIDGIQSWVNKETNRIIAMSNELKKFGAELDICNDSITIYPPQMIKQQISVNTYNDHRIAMAFSILSARGIELIINNYKCVNKTFIDFFEYFKKFSD